MSKNTDGCHYIMVLLSLMTMGLCIFFAIFTLVLTNDSNHMLRDATIAEPGANYRTFRVRSCDVGTSQEEITFWKTVVMPASTVTETATVYVAGHDGPARAATAEMEDVQPTTLVPRVLPTGDVYEPEKKFSIRGMRDGHIVDVNKPEMQM